MIDVSDEEAKTVPHIGLNKAIVSDDDFVFHKSSVRFEALSGSWTRCFESTFPSKMERFFARLDANQKRNRFTQKQKFDKVNRQQIEAITATDKKALLRVADEYQALAEGFGELGDQWMIGQCYIGVATSLEETSFYRDVPRAAARQSIQAQLDALHTSSRLE